MNKTYRATFAVAIVAIISLRCSSQGGQQGEEPVNGADELDGQAQNTSLNGKAAEGKAMNNAVGGNNFASANGGNPAATASANVMTNNLGANPTANPSANPTAVPLNQSAPINAAPTNTATTPTNAAPPTNSTATAPAEPQAPAAPAAPTTGPQVSWDKMNASPFANPQMNWSGKGKVKYITRKVTRHASPDGPVVGEFVMGNHPLIYQNGNWVELSNGTYVKGNATTDKPVGYERHRSTGYAH